MTNLSTFSGVVLVALLQRVTAAVTDPCVNEPGWSVLGGVSCDLIAQHDPEEWCSITASMAGTNGLTSAQACCVCEGGNPETPANAVSTTPSEAPSACVDESAADWSILPNADGSSLSCDNITSGFCDALDSIWNNL